MNRPADNPFASRRIDTLGYRYRESEADHIVEALEANDGRGAVIGPHGSGKTTLLEEITERLDGKIVRIHIGTETRAPFESVARSLPASVEAHHTVLLDGAEQLSPIGWLRIRHRLRPAGSFVITSHRPGRLPTIHECRTDPELLGELVAELAPGTLGAVDLDALYHRHNGNIRLCFRELYDECARSGD